MDATSFSLEVHGLISSAVQKHYKDNADNRTLVFSENLDPDRDFFTVTLCVDVGLVEKVFNEYRLSIIEVIETQTEGVEIFNLIPNAVVISFVAFLLLIDDSLGDEFEVEKIVLQLDSRSNKTFYKILLLNCGRIIRQIQFFCCICTLISARVLKY